jgi:hypothetical protein
MVRIQLLLLRSAVVKKYAVPGQVVAVQPAP